MKLKHWKQRCWNHQPCQWVYSKRSLGILMKTIHFQCLQNSYSALYVLTGICTIVIGILFIWYKRKTSFTSSTMGNLLKLIPSLKEKIPTLDSLLPILSEQAPSQNTKKCSYQCCCSSTTANSTWWTCSTTCVGTKTTIGKTTDIYFCSIPYNPYGTIAFNFNWL